MKSAFIQAVYNADSISHLIDLIMLAAVNLSRDDMHAVLIAYKSRLYQIRGEV